jgi:hypothetical protein
VPVQPAFKTHVSRFCSSELGWGGTRGPSCTKRLLISSNHTAVVRNALMDHLLLPLVFPYYLDAQLFVLELSFQLFTALFLATLIRFWSYELLATSSDRYSSTNFQPPSDLSAMRISLFLFLSTFSESCKTEMAFAYLPCSIQ